MLEFVALISNQAAVLDDADEIDLNSGGRVAYVSPRLLVRLGHDVVARVGLQDPV